MTTVSTKKSAKSKTPPPPTILTLTLNADGTGMLITKRGDLACANSFTYRDMKGIMAAIQQGAAHLVEVEQNPPPDALFAASASSDAQRTTPIAPAEAPSTTEVNATMHENDAAETQISDTPEHAAGSEMDEAGESATSTLLAGIDDLRANVNNPLRGVIRPAGSVQMPLL